MNAIKRTENLCLFNRQNERAPNQASNKIREFDVKSPIVLPFRIVWFARNGAYVICEIGEYPLFNADEALRVRS